MNAPKSPPRLNADLSTAIIAGAEEEAEALGVRVSIAVMDAGGHLLSFLRNSDAPWHTVDIAQDKAYTAVGFGMPTKMLGERIFSAPEAVGQSLILRPRMLLLGGGLPIHMNGVIVGGIGVSGATEEQDIACANAGLRATWLNPADAANPLAV